MSGIIKPMTTEGFGVSTCIAFSANAFLKTPLGFIILFEAII